METVIGLKGKDFVLLAADTMLAKSIFFLRDSKYQYLYHVCTDRTLQLVLWQTAQRYASFRGIA